MFTARATCYAEVRLRDFMGSRMNYTLLRDARGSLDLATTHVALHDWNIVLILMCQSLVAFEITQGTRPPRRRTMKSGHHMRYVGLRCGIL